MFSESCRNHWLVKNVAAELPILGPCFTEAEISKAVKGVLKSSAMLIGGVSFMVADPFDSMSMGEPSATSIAKMSSGMALGMMAGTVAYNVLESAATSMYNCAVSFYSQSDCNGYTGLELNREESNTASV